jgi:hypothetical protein
MANALAIVSTEFAVPEILALYSLAYARPCQRFAAGALSSVPKADFKRSSTATRHRSDPSPSEQGAEAV